MKQINKQSRVSNSFNAFSVTCDLDRVTCDLRFVPAVLLMRNWNHVLERKVGDRFLELPGGE